jgi:hypothetical protein
MANCVVVQNPDFVCAQVLLAKYFPSGDILDAKPLNGLASMGMLLSTAE